MELSQPVDWVNKPFTGYIVNAEFSTENKELIGELINSIQTAFNDAVFCMPKASLHITLLDWIAPLVDYGGQDKDELFAKVKPSYDKAMLESLATLQPIDVCFNELHVSPSTIYMVGHDDGQFQRIRERFTNKVELLADTKLPLSTHHTSCTL